MGAAFNPRSACLGCFGPSTGAVLKPKLTRRYPRISLRSYHSPEGAVGLTRAASRRSEGVKDVEIISTAYRCWPSRRRHGSVRRAGGRSEALPNLSTEPINQPIKPGRRACLRHEASLYFLELQTRIA